VQGAVGKVLDDFVVHVEGLTIRPVVAVVGAKGGETILGAIGYVNVVDTCMKSQSPTPHRGDLA
jgi:hypothetical protein